MSASQLEMSVERFNTALGALRKATDKIKQAQPLTETERSVAVARIDQAIGALQRVLGDGGVNAAGQR